MPLNPQNKITDVWIIGKHPLVAKYLLEILGPDPMIQARWAEGSLPSRNELGEDPVFIFDSAALETSLSRCIQTCNQQCRGAKHIVLDHRLDAYGVCQLLCQGAHGFLAYDQVSASLALAIRSVQNGGMWVDSRVLHKYMRLSKREKSSLTTSFDDQSLTAREEEILHFTQQRLSNKEIASLLNIEVSTVKFHLSNIYSKLEIASRSDLWQNSISQGIIYPLSNTRSVPGTHAKGAELCGDAS